ncbi:M23 family metallopeptidase [Flexivirga sp. ID2601S]|uniref:M23 family metallopeptidase n=1 Tax=Flexivirga aerilata TaxID=1656889 RepID=A0A849AKF9_9MICO|nr:M23 family metallopeptidase [Flexivirga aerilata]NNG39748.1 M23 family metallopeptidase [Flexivirga aerilata]
MTIRWTFLARAALVAVTTAAAATGAGPPGGPPAGPGAGGGAQTGRGAGAETDRGTAPVGGFTWPLWPQPAVARPFDAPPAPWAAGHRGVDLLGAPGRPVLAAGAGRVSFSGVIAGRGVVTVQHANGRRTTYEPLDARDAVGTVVRAGDQIGTLASTGSHCAPRSCLHWGLLVGPEDYRDPLTLLGFRRPRLLPLG